MQIFIQSVPRLYSAYNLHKFSDPEKGMIIGKTKYGNTFDRLSCLYSGKVGGLLNHISYTPWLDENGKQKSNSEGKLLTLQDKEEERWNLPKGHLTNKAWRRGDSLNQADMTYFQKSYWKLNDGTTVLDIDNNFDDCMFYYVALESKFIANSEKELKENKFPFATHYIALQNESEEITYSNNRKRIKAFAALEAKEFTKVWKEKFIHILEISSLLTTLSEEQIENLLYKFIESDSGRINGNIDRFNFLYNQLKTDEGRKSLNARHLLRKAMETRVVYEKSDTYTWNRAKGIIVLGNTYDECLSFLLNPTKDVLIEELEAEIKSKLL